MSVVFSGNYLSADCAISKMTSLFLEEKLKALRVLFSVNVKPINLRFDNIVVKSESCDEELVKKVIVIILTIINLVVN